MGSSPETDILGSGNKLKDLDICKKMSLFGVSNKLGGQIYIIHCNDYANHNSI